MKLIFLVAFIFSISALGLWYMDGAWENGEMPTNGMLKVVGLSFLSLVFFSIAKKFQK